MDGSPSPSNEQRYCALDHFYMRALSGAPPDLLSIVKKALAIVGYRIVTGPFDPACLLSLESDRFLPYLYRLAVIRTEERHVDNSYLRGFLEDPQRSGSFYTPKSESRLHIFRASVHIFNHLSNLTAVFKPALQWIQVNPAAYREEIQGLRTFACVLFNNMIEDAVAKGTVLRASDLRNLGHICRFFPLVSFIRCLKGLCALSVLLY